MTPDKKLMRPREGGIIAGVCAGIARHLGIDVTVIRVLWALAVCLAGTGFLAYVICWIVIPREPTSAV